MQVNASSFTVAEYCEQMRHSGIVVNHDYQRTDKVWPPAARSYLIETMLLGYPLPKLALYQTTDLKTKRTRKEIVDGQQRSQAIYDFLDDKLRLSGKSQFGGALFSQLDPDLQQRFVEYSLTVDLFVGATPEEIRQVFRRMNSYTVPLNPQEKRHATHQGDFKWFIVAMTEKYAGALKQMGVFKEKQLSRMADAALFSDVIYTLVAGLKHASDVTLDRFYTENEAAFPLANEMQSRLDDSLGLIMSWTDIHESQLMKPFNFYTLVLAITHALQPVPSLTPAYPRTGALRLDLTYVLPNLTQLSAALDEPSLYPALGPYIAACSRATNRLEQRRVRFHWMSSALEPRLLP